MRPLALTSALVVALLSSPALASPKLTLNGVPIDGARDQRFENATVVIDAAGDVHVTAKGYAVKGGAPAATNTASTTSSSASAAAAAPSQDPKPTRRYFLATEQSQPDGTQYDVEVFINARWIRVLRSADPQVVMEITRYLRPGANTVTLAATKRLAGVARRSTSREVALRVVIGEGDVSGDRVTMDAPLVVMTRTAAELDDRTEEFTVEAR